MKEFLWRLESVCGRVKLWPRVLTSKRGSSADVTMRWKTEEGNVGFACLTEQSFVGCNYQLINVEGCVTQAAFESFMEEGILILDLSPLDN